MIPKRLFWFGLGAAAGAAGTLRAEAELRARREQLTPGAIASTAVRHAGEFAVSVPDRVRRARAPKVTAPAPDGRDWTGRPS